MERESEQCEWVMVMGVDGVDGVKAVEVIK